MGACIGQNEVNSNNQRKPIINKQTHAQIITLIQLIKHSTHLEQEKLSAKILSKEKLLSRQVYKESDRQKHTQQILIQEIVFYNNMKHINSVLEHDALTILQYKQLLNDSNKIIPIMVNLKELLYCNSIIVNQHLNKLSSYLKSNFASLREIKDQDITNQLILHHKKTPDVTYKMMSQYVLELCSRAEDLKLENINKPGHVFKY